MSRTTSGKRFRNAATTGPPLMIQAGLLSLSSILNRYLAEETLYLSCRRRL
ncbi:hypothetical protein Hanom_Chr12g01069621 [Helianthus anomalus]